MPLAVRPVKPDSATFVADGTIDAPIVGGDMAAAPIGADEFADCMQRLGPFEFRPHLAVGVSGGRDSLALVLLAAEWAAARGGLVTAVTLDHGLRETSAAEAALVATWMARHGIPHHTLAWLDSPGPGTTGMGASEAEARLARYELLETFCRDHGILHLLVGHHRDDQLETQAMRRARSSGMFGQAGMPAVRELAHMRVLRPLLDIARPRVTATLHARGQIWIEDPSNQDTRFARARMRTGGSTLPFTGPDVRTETARVRVAAERELARVAARFVAVHPAGFATLDPAFPDVVDRETGGRVIARLVTCIAGRVYAPRGARLNRLAERVITGALGGGATLGGCTVRPGVGGTVRIARELAAIDGPRPVMGARENHRGLDWDGRFRVLIPAASGSGAQLSRTDEVRLGAVGQFSDLGVPEHPDSPRYDALPHAVRMALPAIFRGGRFHVCALPFSSDSDRAAGKAWFAPKNAVAGAVFATGW